MFGCSNVHSAAGKTDDIIAMKRDQSIDVLCLCETWHDEDSVSIRRQQVLERARPRSASELSTLSTNHRTMPHGTECRLCRVAGNTV